MADVFTPEKRSAVMAAIRSTGTKPEERLLALVTAAVDGRFEVVRQAQDLAGTPDVAVPELRLALFADGCFFHCCPRHGRIPATNADYWGPKLARNVRRDRRERRRLRADGWAVWRFWEHDLRGVAAAARTERLLAARLARREALVRGR